MKSQAVGPRRAQWTIPMGILEEKNVLRNVSDVVAEEIEDSWKLS